MMPIQNQCTALIRINTIIPCILYKVLSLNKYIIKGEHHLNTIQHTWGTTK